MDKPSIDLAPLRRALVASLRANSLTFALPQLQLSSLAQNAMPRCPNRANNH